MSDGFFVADTDTLRSVHFRRSCWKLARATAIERLEHRPPGVPICSACLDSEWRDAMTTWQLLGRSTATLALVLAMVGTAGAQTAGTLTAQFSPVPGALAYDVLASPDGHGPFAITLNVPAAACTPTECRASFPQPSVRTCYRIQAITPGASASTTVASCYDPAWEPIAPPSALGVSK